MRDLSVTLVGGINTGGWSDLLVAQVLGKTVTVYGFILIWSGTFSLSNFSRDILLSSAVPEVVGNCCN